MAGYTVKTDVFEGPFDLLLHLVSKQRLDVSAISISEVADQYLEHIERMQELDLDVASDFLLVAATLLEIKASSLLPKEERYIGEDLDDLSPEEARDILIARLVAYKQFKNIALELGARMESEGRMHPRQAGLETDFLGLMPDYLEGVSLRSLALICADLEHRREVFLLEAEHVASMPISLELHAETMRRKVQREGLTRFSDIVGKDPDPELVVVSLLAVLELYKRGYVEVRQERIFGDIEMEALSDEERAVRAFHAEEPPAEVEPALAEAIEAESHHDATEEN